MDDAGDRSASPSLPRTSVVHAPGLRAISTKSVAASMVSIDSSPKCDADLCEESGVKDVMMHAPVL